MGQFPEKETLFFGDGVATTISPINQLLLFLQTGACLQGRFRRPEAGLRDYWGNERAGSTDRKERYPAGHVLDPTCGSVGTGHGPALWATIMSAA